MTIMRDIARKLFGRSIEIIDLRIAFHKDANFYGTHGHIIATHVDHGLMDEEVRFVFLGVSKPPALTPHIVNFIWEEAKAKGFIPHSISSYGHVLRTHSSLNPRDIVSAERRAAEDQRATSSVPAVTRQDIATVNSIGQHAGAKNQQKA